LFDPLSLYLSLSHFLEIEIGLLSMLAPGHSVTEFVCLFFFLFSF
jgi:hypothetical protein